MPLFFWLMMASMARSVVLPDLTVTTITALATGQLGSWHRPTERFYRLVLTDLRQITPGATFTACPLFCVDRLLPSIGLPSASTRTQHLTN
jgi:hypothetical protein